MTKSCDGSGIPTYVEVVRLTMMRVARAKIRVMVKLILNRYGSPPDLQDEAVKTVLQQAEAPCRDWA